MVRLRKFTFALGMIAVFFVALFHHFAYKNPLNPLQLITKDSTTENTLQNLKSDAVILGLLPPILDIPRELAKAKTEDKKLGNAAIKSNYSSVRKLTFPGKASPPQMAGLIPVGVNVRPLIANPEKYALEMTRLKVRLEMYGFQSMSKFAVNGSKPVLPPLDVEKKKIILLTYWRTGSTFIGDIINQYPGTFYSFEPLHSLTQNDVINDSVSETKAVSLLSDFLRCNYKEHAEYFKWVIKPENQFLLQHNFRLWTTCRLRTAMCFDPKFVSAACSEYPVQLTKITRLSLAPIKSLLDEFPDLKVLHLVRDPRGILSSRMSLPWCKTSKSCIESEMLCERIRNDLLVFNQLLRDYPNRLLLVKYEDVSLAPVERVQEIFKFLGFDLNKKVIAFLKSHTQLKLHESQGGPYSTKRNSKTAPFAWRHKLTLPEVNRVQETCDDVLNDLGYQLITSGNELKDNITISET